MILQSNLLAWLALLINMHEYEPETSLPLALIAPIFVRDREPPESIAEMDINPNPTLDARFGKVSAKLIC